MILTKSQYDKMIKVGFLSLHMKFMNQAIDIVAELDLPCVEENIDRYVGILWRLHCHQN